MIRPAGDSSDDDEYKDYFSDDDLPVKNKPSLLREPTETELQQQIANSLFTAIIKGEIESVTSILDNGFDVNMVLKDNWTPLLLAASVSNPDVVKELINRHADVNAYKDFYTPLMASSSCPLYTSTHENSLYVAEQLITNGADVDAKTRKRKTALMYAASNGNVGIVKMLLPICDKHIQDNQGWTALFWAVNDNKADVLGLLLEAGLEFEKFDVRGNTPLHYARTNDFEEIIDMLPCREKQERNYGIPDAMYDMSKLFEDERPKFLRDVCVMLYGMKSDQHTDLILNNGIILLSFLCLTDADLLKLGIQAPYQRYRILNGLYRFHKHMYKVSSVPIVPKDAPYSTYDVLSSIVVACRQLAAMEASLRYLLLNVRSMDELASSRKEIEQIKVKLRNLRCIAVTLNQRAKQWDLENQPADLITCRSYKKLRKCPLKKYATLGAFCLVTLVMIRKFYHS